MRTKTRAATIKRLRKVASLLNRYADSWCENPPPRMWDWIDEYMEVKYKDPDTWKAYCDATGFAIDHDAYDNLA